MIVIGCFVFIIYIPNMQISEKNVMIGIGKVEKKDPIIDKFEYEKHSKRISYSCVFNFVLDMKYLC